MNQRVNPFANLAEVPAFEPKPKKEMPVANAAIERIAEENSFPSRQAPKMPKEPRRKKRVHKTGRNVQLNLKATSQTIERFYKLADERRVPLGKLLEDACDALEGAEGSR